MFFLILLSQAREIAWCPRALSTDSQHPCKSQACPYVPGTLALEVGWGGGGRRISGTSWLSAWLKNISRLCERACLRGIKAEGDRAVHLTLMGIYTNVYSHSPICAYIYP